MEIPNAGGAPPVAPVAPATPPAPTPGVVATQTPATPPTNPPATPATPPTGVLTISAEEYQRLLTDRNVAEQHRQSEAAKASQADAARLKAIADKDGIAAALTAVQQAQAEKDKTTTAQLESLRSSLHNAAKSSALSSALVGVTFRNAEAARDAQEKLARGFEVIDVNGSPIVRQIGTGMDVATAVAAALKNTDAYGHFLAPSTQGGAGTGRTDGTSADAPAGWIAPTNPGQEAYALYLKQRTEAQANGRLGFGLSFGTPAGPIAGHVAGPIAHRN